ncbi:MAG: TetR/AcrR family transcriptional regulator [Amnibacterium sp.]
MHGSVEPVDELPWREQKKRLTRQALHTEARRLVLESGPGAVTVEAICHAAGVSPRTFFNYFPSKAAAALGVPEFHITDEHRARFLAGPTGSVVHDLCDLVASGLGTSGGLSDRESIHELLHRRPELKPDLFHWLGGIRRAFTDVAEERLAPEDARRAVTLVMASLVENLEEDAPGLRPLGDRLWDGVVALCALVSEPTVLNGDARGLQPA